jgi:choline-phosphate cytidylyltransferase
MMALLLIGRLAGVDKRILNRTKVIGRDRKPEYALGFLYWFVLYRIGAPLPPYKIYHLIGDADKELVSNILEKRLDEFDVAKQYYMLQSENATDNSFKQAVISLVGSAVRPLVKNTASKKRRFDTSKAFEALCSINSLLRKQGLRPFLVSGTLLGFIRDNGLIEGDNDLDIGIMNDETSGEAVFQLLLDNPIFRSVYNLGHLIQATHTNGTVIDVFIHYRESDGIWHGSDIHKWVNSHFELSEANFQSHTFYVPDNPNRYLDENYGDWSSPVLFWDYSFDTPNREFFRTRKTVFYLVERIINELKKKSPARFPVETAIAHLKTDFDIDLTHHLGGNAVPNKTRTVITFGTFDLFHIGHLNILKRAATYGNRLVVGVSSDAMNITKKNTSPVYCQEDRMAIVGSIECVDEVIIEESLEFKRQYISKYGASVLVMGDDWKGKFDDLSDNCEVVYLPRTDNISTSETKDSIKRNL